MNISEFFRDVLGAELSNARWSWGALNPLTNQLFLSLWEHDLETIEGAERISVLMKDYVGRSQGFPERKKHVQALRNGVEGYGVLCTAKDPRAARNRTIDYFDQHLLLKLGELSDEGDRVYARILARIPVRNLPRHQTAHASTVPDLRSILEDAGDVTAGEALAQARVGQGRFRQQVLEMWGLQCCVTGAITLDAIRASHIKPWRDCTNRERLDPNNGLPLVATLDALFDAGLVTFAPDGRLLASKRLDNAERQRLGISALRLGKEPNHHTATYLAYHRKEVFIRE